MELLEAVNMCLSALTEARVTNINVRHPSVDLIKTTLDIKRKAVLEKGYWFNTYDVVMTPNGEGRIEYPVDAITVQSGDANNVYIPRDKMLFDVLNNTQYFTKPVTLTVSVDIDFANLPECVANVVLYRTMRAVYVADFGYDQTLSDMNQNEMLATLMMEQLHLRNMKYNTRSRRGFVKYTRALRG